MFFYLVASVAVVLTGIAKAGFGGGVGIAATPLMILVAPPPVAPRIILPILCVCDWFALYHYRRTFDKPNLVKLMPGVVVGIGLASFFLGKVDESRLKFWIGVLCVLFVGYQLGKTWINREWQHFRPKTWQGWCFGFGVGVTSTLAHAAGPVATMFLLPQNLGRRLFVGTTVILFTFVNALKLIPYFYLDMINLERLSVSLVLLPLVPIGTGLGVWMNQKLNETTFNTVIYVLLLLVGLNLTTGFDIVSFVASRFS